MSVSLPKTHALSRISQYLSQHKKQFLFKTFKTSHFNRWTLAWRCHNSSLNNKTNNNHKRALRRVYIEKKSNFQDLLRKDKSASILMKNLQYLATEI